MKKILVPNGSYCEENIIKIFKEMGLYVITTGNAPNLSGHKYADEYVCHDYSDSEGILSIAQDKAIDYVSTCANDFGVITAAYVAEKMGLPGHDTYQNAKTIGEKDRFKDFAQKNHLMVIPSRGFSAIEEALNYIEDTEYPIIIKPTDLSGGKGVTRVLEKQEAEAAVRYAFDRSKARHIVIEPFISGTQHSITTFLLNEKVAVHGSFNEYAANSKFLVGASSCPADVPGEALTDLIGQIEKMASLLHLSDGLFHAQFILDQDGIPRIIECMRRPLGNHALEELQNSTGIDWEKWIARGYCGMDCTGIVYETREESYTSELYIQAPSNGVVSDVRISVEIEPYIARCINMGWSGMRIDNYMVDKLGFLFLRFPDKATRDSILKDIKNHIQVDMEKI